MKTISNNFGELSELSKIRKFVFSDLKNANLLDVYNNLWLEMENLFLSDGKVFGRLSYYTKKCCYS